MVADPVAVAPPRVEGSVIVGFLDGIEHIAAFDEVAAPAAVADVDAGPGTIVDRGVVHRDFGRHGYLHGCRLAFDPTDAVDQAILDRGIGRIVVRLRTG
jgi:hypothetical protein